MINNKSIKFKIELATKSSSRDDIAYIYEQITLFLDTISDMADLISINTIVTDDDAKKYTHGSTIPLSNPKPEYLKNSINSFKEKFYNVPNRKEIISSFDKYINSLPNYYKKPQNHYQSKLLDHTKDYLIKNRSARLIDIVNYYKEQGFILKSKNYIKPVLKKLINGGHVTKEDKVYSWNYKEE